MKLPVLNDFFAGIVTATSKEPLLTPPTCDLSDGFEIQALSVNQTAVMLSKINQTTATGPDELPGFLLKKLSSAIAPNITKIINCSIKTGVFPRQWKEANVVAIWKKKGKKSEASNYRPIFILPVLGRITEKACATQLHNYCEQ